MPEETQILYILGPVGILFFFAIKEFFSYLKSKKNNKNDNGTILKTIQDLKSNHLEGINIKLDNLISQFNQMEQTLNKIINLLIEIKGKLNK